MEAQPPNRMDSIVASRYSPLVLHQALNSLCGGDYQKYLPRFNGQGEVTTKEHWNAYLSYDENKTIKHRDVWM